ncbi:MAG: hypothetical protein CMJ18_13320, partial [Phycisphaeraceae bacterium]|nr:hypothetical protein [Phycisphaeraceae bacterium]
MDRSRQRHRRSRVGPCAFEPLEARILLAFTPSGFEPGGSHAAWADYNNDGWTDLSIDGTMFENIPGTGGGRAFRQRRTLGHWGIWGDLNNDGLLDWFTRASPGTVAITEVPGFTYEIRDLPALPETRQSRGAAFADFNGDGWIDLYVGAYEDFPSAYYKDALLLNNQGESFTVHWVQGLDAVVTRGRPRPARGVAAADFDNDGDPDIYTSNYRLEPNGLWVNDGAGNITDQASSRGVSGFAHTIGSSWGDIDSDGNLDLFVGNFSHPGQEPAHFMRNLGPGGGYAFERMDSLDGADWQESYASPSLADYDNDGDLDLLFTTVYPGNAARLYRNDGNWNFTNVTGSEGLGGVTVTYQNAWADYDNDGDLDVIVNGTLYDNDLDNANRWLKVALHGGSGMNATAIGAQVRIRTGGRTYTREVMSSTGEGNGDDHVLHFGLGGASGSVPVEITWPDGTVETFSTTLNRRIDRTRQQAEPGRIIGNLWRDTDGDGVIDGGETRLAGWTVFLDANGNGVLNPGEPQRTTGSQGGYTFADLEAGTYHVDVVVQGGWEMTFPSGGRHVVSLSDGQNVSRHFGFDVTVVPAPLPYSENFNDGSADGLEPVSGAWQENAFGRYEAIGVAGGD